MLNLSFETGDESMAIELNKMNLTELKKHRNEVDKMIEGYEERQTAELLAEFEEIARSKGMRLSDVIGGGGKVKVKRTSSMKYQDLNNPDNQWTGRGRRPAWFLAATDAGIKEEDMLIK